MRQTVGTWRTWSALLVDQGVFRILFKWWKGMGIISTEFIPGTPTAGGLLDCGFNPSRLKFILRWSSMWLVLSNKKNSSKMRSGLLSEVQQPAQIVGGTNPRPHQASEFSTPHTLWAVNIYSRWVGWGGGQSFVAQEFSMFEILSLYCKISKFKIYYCFGKRFCGHPDRRG